MDKTLPISGGLGKSCGEASAPDMTSPKPVSQIDGIATAAMAGLLANPNCDSWPSDIIAAAAYDIAKSMMKEREK